MKLIPRPYTVEREDRWRVLIGAWTLFALGIGLALISLLHHNAHGGSLISMLPIAIPFLVIGAWAISHIRYPDETGNTGG